MKKGDEKVASVPHGKRKFRKIVFLVFVVCPAFIVTLFVILRLIYTGERLSVLVSEKLTEALDRPVSVESVSIDPLGKIDVRQFVMSFSDAEGDREGAMLKLKRLTIRYRPLSLLRRRLDITDVSVEEPQLHLVSAPIEEIVTVEKEEPDKTPIPSLPLSLGLFRLTLNDFRFAMTMVDSSGERELAISGVHLDISGLRFPRKFVENPNNLRGRIRLTIPEGELQFGNEEYSFHTAVNLDLNGHWKSKGKWDLGGGLALKPLDSDDSRGIGLLLKINGVGYGREIRVDGIDFFLGTQTPLHVEGKLEHLGPDARFDLTILSQTLNIRESVAKLRKVLPAAWIEPVEPMLLAGNLRLADGSALGDLENIQFRFRSEFTDSKVGGSSGKWLLDDGTVNVQVSGIWTPEGLKDGRIDGNAIVGNITYYLNDSTSISTGEYSMDFSSRLDSAFLPIDGNLEGSVKDVLGGDLNLRVGWRSDEEAGTLPEKLIVDGKIQADSLDVQSFPFDVPISSGKMNFIVDLATHGLEDIRLRLIGESPGVVYMYSQKEEKTPPLELVSDMYLHGEPKFQDWSLDSGTVRLKDIITGRIEGFLSTSDSKFELALVSAEIRNTEAFNFLPALLKDQLEGMEIWGREVMSVGIAGERADDSYKVSMNGRLRFVDVGMDYPMQLLRIDGIHGYVDVTGSPERMGGNGDVVVESILIGTMRSEPFEGSRLIFDGGMLPGDSLWIEGKKITVTPLGIDGNVFFGLGQIAEAPRMYGKAEVRFQSKDSVEIIPGLSVLGALTCRLDGKTLNPEKKTVRLVGELVSDSLNMNMKDGFRMRRMRGRIPFRFDVDQLNRRFIPHPTYTPPGWTEYESQRSVFRYIIPETGNVTIDAVELAGYGINDVKLDLDVRNGYVNVPWFNLNVLDGNFGGAVQVNLGEGGKRDVAYNIRAQASQINSASLAGIRVEDKEETELNASLAFQGKGIDFDRGIDLEGFFHITKIGPQFASTLLQSMDPRGSDRSIRMTRRFLNSGWKPVLFSFELRHGHVYPSLVLSQPWFSPVRIPERLEYGRLPLEFFLKPQ